MICCNELSVYELKTKFQSALNMTTVDSQNTSVLLICLATLQRVGFKRL